MNIFTLFSGCLAGAFGVEPYEWNGETRLNFRLTTNPVLALRPAPRKASGREPA
jgi:hypothetical protein